MPGHAPGPTPGVFPPYHLAGQRPRQTGRRLSMNACMPSRASSLASIDLSSGPARSTIPLMTAQTGVNALVEEVLPQGGWDDGDYLWLTDHARRLVEFTDGYLEVLPMPSREHQRIVAFLYTMLHAYIRHTGGEVLFAPLRLRIREGKFREPDLVLLRDSEDVRSADRFWTGADLVVEVVSPDDRGRDFVHKRGDYAEAGIPEYWIVEPGTETITVLTLAGGTYVERMFDRTAHASSEILHGFGVAVDDVLRAGDTA